MIDDQSSRPHFQKYTAYAGYRMEARSLFDVKGKVSS
jgi:hypothetical protein